MIDGIDWIAVYAIWLFLVSPALIIAVFFFFDLDYDIACGCWIAGMFFPVTILCGVFIGILWVGKRAWISRKSLIVAIINWLTPKAGK